RAREGGALHRQEGGRGGGRVVDGRRARGPGARRRGDLPAALPGPGADARHRSRAQGRLPTSLSARPLIIRSFEGALPMLRVAVPNKGALAESAAQMLREAGYRQRTDPKDLVCRDESNDIEFFYLR